jgi:site-specific recombinase XerD
LRQALKRNTDCHWTGRYFDKKPVKNFLQELELNSYTAVIADYDSAVIHPAATAFLINKTLTGNKIRSVKKYASIIKSLINEISFDPNLSSFDDLSDSDMSNYLELVLMGDRGNVPTTINQVETTLSDFFSFMKDQGFARHGDRFTFYKTQEAEIKIAKAKGRQNSHDPFKLSERYIPKAEFENLLKHASAKSPYFRDRNEIILRLGYEAGMRAHEITSFNNLSLMEIEASIKKAERRNLNEIEIDVIGKGNKLRSVVIEPDLRRKIEAFIRSYRSRLNGQLICSSNGEELNDQYATTIFNRAKKRLVKYADIDSADRWDSNDGWTFHALRHSFATNLAIRIENAEAKLGRSYLMDRLGHNRPQTTVIYLHFAAAILGKLKEHDSYEEEMRRKAFYYDKEEFSG